MVYTFTSSWSNLLVSDDLISTWLTSRSFSMTYLVCTGCWS